MRRQFIISQSEPFPICNCKKLASVKLDMISSIRNRGLLKFLANECYPYRDRAS